MDELFDSGNKQKHEPLAARMRPRTLDEYIGQDHIVGKGRLLRRAIQADQLSSVIFYGPPGTGKTTLARVIANHTKSNFITLNAVLTGVQNIRDAISEADQQRKLYGRRTILFVDEVHRWNKSQQDALLPWVENGTFILIGATTENPRKQSIGFKEPCIPAKTIGKNRLNESGCFCFKRQRKRLRKLEC